MSDSKHTLTDKELERTLGPLNEDEIADLRDRLADFDGSAETDLAIDELLRETAGEVTEVNVPDIPPATRELFDARRKEALEEVAAEEEDLESTIYSKPRRYEEPSEKKSLFDRFRLPVGLAVGAAAVVAAGLFFLGERNSGSTGTDILYADAVSVLTPGEVTGFTEPVLTWKAANGGAADIEVVDAAGGAVLAKLDQAFSPVRWSALDTQSSLKPGTKYEVRVLAGKSVLASRTFSTEGKETAPTPAENLDGIVQQCEELIAANRSADAWMLWAELNAAQKSDPRMQELKQRILQEIG